MVVSEKAHNYFSMYRFFRMTYGLHRTIRLINPSGKLPPSPSEVILEFLVNNWTIAEAKISWKGKHEALTEIGVTFRSNKF